MRVNISIDDKLLEDFDKHCDKFRYTRSELLSKIMRDVVYGTTTVEDKPIDMVEKKIVDAVNIGTMTVEDKPYRGKPAGENEKYGVITWEWCKALACHPFVPNEVKECAFVNSVDGDGNPANMGGKGYSQAFICTECIDYLCEHAPEGIDFEQAL